MIGEVKCLPIGRAEQIAFIETHLRPYDAIVLAARACQEFPERLVGRVAAGAREFRLRKAQRHIMKLLRAYRVRSACNRLTPGTGLNRCS